MFLRLCETIKWFLEILYRPALKRFALRVHHGKAFLSSEILFLFSLKLDEDQTFTHVKVNTTLQAVVDPKSGP